MDDSSKQKHVPSKSEMRKVVLASLLGATIEWYDFFLYGVVAGIVFNKLYFPTADPFIGTILAYSTFAIGYLARPLGGAPTMLWQPWQAWLALSAPVRLTAADTMVDRGSSARLEIVALGQQRATLRLRAPGETWRGAQILEA